MNPDEQFELVAAFGGVIIVLIVILAVYYMDKWGDKDKNSD